MALNPMRPRPAEDAADAPTPGTLDPRTIVGELYRGLLDREADQDGLNHHSAALGSGTALAQLLRGFVASPEFVSKHGGSTPVDHYIRVDQDPPLRIDLDLTAPQLARLWAHVGATWATLGQDDPYWSVLTDPRFHLPNMSDAAVLQFFYDSGQTDLKRLDAWLRRNHLALRSDMVCAEYGCGVGRLTGWLARRCKQVRAFDISPTHLARAQEWLTGQDVRNIDFHLVRNPSDLNRLAGIDLFFSSIVLQHNPPPIIALILDHAFRHLRPGGLAFFQVPTYTRNYAFDLERYLSGIGSHEGMEMHVLTQQDIFALANRHGVVPLEVEQDGLISGWGTSHTFLLRKAA
jgi:SAM-dependent methyltransferase